MGSGSYFEFLWDQPSGLLLIYVERASVSTVALLGFRIFARYGDGKLETLAVIPFRNESYNAPYYSAVTLPDVDDLQISVTPIIDKARGYDQDSALFDDIDLIPPSVETGPAAQTVWAVSLDPEDDHASFLDIRDYGVPANGRQISGLYLSQRHGTVLHPSRSLTQASNAHHLKVEVEHRFDPRLNEDLYDVIVTPNPGMPPAVPIAVNLETILAAEEACQYLEVGLQSRQQWSDNHQSQTLQPGQAELRFTIPGPVHEQNGERWTGYPLGFLDRVLIWTNPAATLDFVTHERRSTQRQDNGLLLLVSLGGGNLQQDQGHLRQVMQELTSIAAAPRPDEWYRHVPSLGRFLGTPQGIDCSAIAQFAYANCAQDILTRVGGAAASRWRPASLTAYLRNAQLFELLRHDDFATVAAGVRAPIFGPADDDGQTGLLFELASASLRGAVSPDAIDDPVAGDLEDEAETVELWLNAFRQRPWQLVELSVFPNAGAAMRFGLLPDGDDFGQFDSDVAHCRDDARKFQASRARVGAWNPNAQREVRALIACHEVPSSLLTVQRMEEDIIAMVGDIGNQLGVSARDVIVGNELPPVTMAKIGTGQTAQAALTLFRDRAEQAVPPNRLQRFGDDSSLLEKIATFLVAVIGEDCRAIDRAVESLGLSNPVLEDAGRLHAHAGVAEAPISPYRPQFAGTDPQVMQWLDEPSSRHRIVETWRRRLASQLS